jgi:hypothetical protein
LSITAVASIPGNPREAATADKDGHDNLCKALENSSSFEARIAGGGKKMKQRRKKQQKSSS